MVTLATDGNNSEIGVDSLPQSMLRVLEKVFRTKLERSKEVDVNKCVECESKRKGKAKKKRGLSRNSESRPTKWDSLFKVNLMTIYVKNKPTGSMEAFVCVNGPVFESFCKQSGGLKAFSVASMLSLQQVGIETLFYIFPY
ncbi:hypothetical protein J1N35_036856 [Gossypium stocksii]|uniref:Uncharacterized protein n=1 Tax=Gossypium stocksii TaxID=47602 RepID=A0A9D3UIY4_9ROSI|nr:hypothetical protein J1N35_036856 [Gossypium stocksii]